MIAFIAGFFIGGFFGVAIMCLLSVARDSDEGHEDSADDVIKIVNKDRE